MVSQVTTRAAPAARRPSWARSDWTEWLPRTMGNGRCRGGGRASRWCAARRDVLDADGVRIEVKCTRCMNPGLSGRRRAVHCGGMANSETAPSAEAWQKHVGRWRESGRSVPDY
jgi:hypothetical protein